MKRYYMKSGSFGNGIIITVFESKKDRDDYVAGMPDNSMVQSHFDHNCQAITRREAEKQIANNNRHARDYQHYGAAYGQEYGTTGRIEDIEPVDCFGVRIK